MLGFTSEISFPGSRLGTKVMRLRLKLHRAVENSLDAVSELN